MSLQIRDMTPADHAAWDRFNQSMSNGTFFHRSGWARVIRDAFGHKPLYTCAIRDGAITGILPMAQVKTMLFGNTLISVPFCVYGGPVAADAETGQALLEHAQGLLPKSGATAMEFRHRDPLDLPDGWVPGPPLYVTFRKAIEADHDKNMKAIPRKQRAMVRKGIQNNLSSIADRNADRLHTIYAESVRNLGTPVFSRKYFRILMDEFADDADIVTILDKGTPVTSVMNFYFRDEVLPYYGGGTSAARNVAGNDFMYWEVMRRAADRGFRLFDFGRSKRDTGAFAFKHNWGFSESPLHYAFRLMPGQSIPEHNPTNPKYRFFIDTWKKLPLPVANTLGPFIVRGVG